jgi:hypothetical protein
MYDIPLRYLASVFVDAASLRATPDATITLLERFKHLEVLPISVEEVGIPRLAFSSSDRGITVVLLGGRFDVTLRPLKASDDKLPAHNMGDFNSFCTMAAELLLQILDYTGRRAHRLAAVQEGLISRLTADGLSTVRQRLLTLPQEVPQEDVFEWDYRFAYRLQRTFGEYDETTYNIATVLRRKMQLEEDAEHGPKELAGIQVGLDLNTLPENTQARFSSDGISAFFASAPEWHNDLQRRLEALMEVGAAHDR